jgi:hypothetical protein
MLYTEIKIILETNHGITEDNIERILNESDFIFTDCAIKVSPTTEVRFKQLQRYLKSLMKIKKALEE